MRIGPSIVCALALAAPLAAQAEIYRWVDDRGVINYSSVRPEGVKKVTQIAEDNGRVSTVHGMSQELLAQQRQLELEARIQRLERELYEQRARDAMAAAQSYPAYPYPAYSPGYAAYPAFPVYGFGSWRRARSSRGTFAPSSRTRPSGTGPSGTRRCGACAADRGPSLPRAGEGKGCLGCGCRRPGGCATTDFARPAPGARHNRPLTSPHVEPTR